MGTGIRLGGALALALALVTGAGAAEAPHKLVLAGDSTMQKRPAEGPAGSWGEALAPALKEGFEIANFARGGRSTRTYRPEWEQNVLPHIRPGDWVIIQFGHNDMSKASDPKAPERRTDPKTEYKDNLRRYVRETREKGANPILVTSITLFLFDTNGVWRAQNPLTPWVTAMREVAAETGTPCVDMNALTVAAVQEAGFVRASKWYMRAVNGKDWAHPTIIGARIFATLFLFGAEGRCGAFPAVKPLEGDAIQAQIDAASAGGGGTVTLPVGLWTIEPLRLKNGVTLRVPTGCTLYGSLDVDAYRSRGCSSLIYAEGAEHLALEGGGRIDGRGAFFPFPQPKPGKKATKKDAAAKKDAAKAKSAKNEKEKKRSSWRPHLVDLRNCRDVRVEGLTLENGGSWTFNPRGCDGVVVRNVTLWSHVNHCNDGLDISSKNVLIENCTVDADDDALVFKTPQPDIVVANVEVRNCTFASSCNAIKFGTETHGAISNVTIHDCRIVPPTAHARFDWRTNSPGVANYLTGLAGVAVETVDGGQLDNVTVRNLTIAGSMTPLFVRLGARNPPREGRATYLRNVRFENVKGKAGGRIACSVTGVPGLKPENIVFRNVELTFPGGGTETEAQAVVPEREKNYPECRMFNGQALPAYGFYVRHAEKVAFENVTTRLAKGATEARKSLVVDDATVTQDAACRFQVP